MTLMTKDFRKILRHESLLTFQLACLACSAQLILQWLPLPHLSQHFHAWSWLVAGTVLVLGAISDSKFYKNRKISQVKWERLSSNCSFFIVSTALSAYLVQYLEIYEAAFTPDPEILEAHLRDTIGPDFFRTRLITDFGSVTGVVLLLCTHYLAMVALISLLRVGLVVVQLGLGSFSDVAFQLKKWWRRNVKKNA